MVQVLCWLLYRLIGLSGTTEGRRGKIYPSPGACGCRLPKNTVRYSLLRTIGTSILTAWPSMTSNDLILSRVKTIKPFPKTVARVPKKKSCFSKSFANRLQDKSFEAFWQMRLPLPAGSALHCSPLAAAAGRRRWGHGHAVTTKFWVGGDSDNQTHLPSKFIFSSDFGHLILKMLINQNVINACLFYVDCAVFFLQFCGFRLQCSAHMSFRTSM